MASASDLVVNVDLRASFDWDEARDMIALAAVIEQGEQLAIGESPAQPPAGWQLIFDSGILGAFDNKWQLWLDSAARRYVVNVRGTDASKISSVIEDLLAVMIPARGLISAGGGAFEYIFGTDPLSGVHLGFALGALVLLYHPTAGILTKLSDHLGPEPMGRLSLIISGHSQGAALAVLIRQALEHEEIFERFSIMPKTYAYAQPKPGNDHLAREVELLPGCYRVTNSEDWVPQLPLTLQLLSTLNTPNLLTEIPGEPLIHLALMGVGGLLDHLIGVHLAKYAPQLLALKELWAPAQARVTKGDFSRGYALPMSSLNFEPAGVPITLAGIHDENAKDGTYQHHAATYLQLMQPKAEKSV